MSMSHLEVPVFPRGFLLADRPLEPPPSYIAGPLLPNFHVHPWTSVKYAGNKERFVIVLGHCVPTHSETAHDPAYSLLENLRSSEGEFFRALNEYSGRHAIIFGNEGNISVINDATAMRSVFYAVEGGIVASHALLVERALGGEVVRDDLLFAYGYPGNSTPYRRTKILTANTYYWFTAHLIRRFWPFTAPPERTIDQVASYALEAASRALRNIGRVAPVKMALTAGLDSRVILAVGIYSGIDFETYTYGSTKATALDRAFAPDLAALAGAPHTLVAARPRTRALTNSVGRANYSSHHGASIPGLMEFFGDPGTAAVTGNLLEIGRSFYSRFRDEGVAPPISSESMAQLHLKSMPPKVQHRIEHNGLESFLETSEQAFHSFVEDTGYKLAVGVLEPYDHFYWEHRMAVWHGPALLERDYYGVSFIPFNTRRIFEEMLGVPVESRDTSKVFYRMIEMVNPALLELPVNPKRWPSKTHGEFHKVR